MTQVTERLFLSPDLEAELSVPVRKKRHETQLAVFNKLQTIAAEKLEELDSFVDVHVRYEMFTQRVQGVEFSRLLHQGTGSSSMAPPTNTPAVSQNSSSSGLNIVSVTAAPSPLANTSAPGAGEDILVAGIVQYKYVVYE